MINEFYELLATELKEIKINDTVFFKEVYPFSNQMRDVEGRTFKTPCVFVEFKPIIWETLTKTKKIADVDFSLHIITERGKSAKHRYTVNELVHEQLDGLSDSYFKPIECTGDDFDKQNNQLLEDIIDFITIVEHEFKNRQTTATKPALNINDVAFTEPTENRTKVLNSVGLLIKELAPGEWFYIPKHKIINEQDGSIIAQLEFNQDYYFNPGEKAKVNNSTGTLVQELAAGESYNIPKHATKKQSGTIVAQQEFDEDFVIQNTIVTDNGVQHEVEYGNTYTCSTLQERIIYVDFSEGKTITIPITAKNQGTYTTLTTTLTATIKKNGNVVTLPFTVATGDSLTIDVTANGTLELGGTYE